MGYFGVPGAQIDPFWSIWGYLSAHMCVYGVVRAGTVRAGTARTVQDRFRGLLESPLKWVILGRSGPSGPDRLRRAQTPDPGSGTPDLGSGGSRDPRSGVPGPWPIGYIGYIGYIGPVGWWAGSPAQQGHP